MQITVRLIILALISSSTVLATCIEEDKRRVKARFDNCTSEYKTEWVTESRTVANNREEERLACELVMGIVETCGEEWRECHGEEDLRIVRERLLKSLILNNPRMNIEQCQAVRHFRYSLKCISCKMKKIIREKKRII